MVQVHVWLLLALPAATLIIGAYFAWNNARSKVAAAEGKAKTQVKSWLDSEIQKAEAAVAKVLANIKAKI